jgi:hypothetical protein
MAKYNQMEYIQNSFLMVTRQLVVPSTLDVAWKNILGAIVSCIHLSQEGARLAMFLYEVQSDEEI